MLLFCNIIKSSVVEFSFLEAGYCVKNTCQRSAQPLRQHAIKKKKEEKKQRTLTFLVVYVSLETSCPLSQDRPTCQVP